MSAGPTRLLVILSQVLRDAYIRLCGFLTKELRRVVAALASRKECVVLINELGKMELASTRFREAVVALLDQSVPIVASVQMVPAMAGSAPQP